MVQLLKREREESAGACKQPVEVGWRVFPVRDGLYDLLGVLVEAGRGGTLHAWLLRGGDARRESWVLIGDESIRVNGTALAGGIRALEHRDEIRVEGEQPIFFSTECPPKVEPFPGAERPARCPRCRLVLEVGQPAVRCTRCLVWSHETADLPCWSYAAAESCAACHEQPNTLENRLTWVPSE